MAKKNTQPSSKGKRLVIPDHVVSEFDGLNTYIKDITELKDGETPDAINWLTGTKKDHIELRGGTQLLGTNRNSGSGRITGIGVGQMQNGMQVPFFTFGEKILYYNATTNLTAECSTTNILGTAANGEDVAIMPYQNLAGSFVYFTSPDSSILKVATANPASVVDLNSKSYRGLAKIDTNRMFMWQRKDINGNPYNTQLFLGVSDKATVSQYTQYTAQSSPTSNSIGTGDGTTKTFSGNVGLPIGSNNATESVFNVEIAAPISAGATVTGISAAVQAVVSMGSLSDTNKFTVGMPVIITGVVGMTQINGLIGFVVAISPSLSITISINSSAFSAWSSGGMAYPSEYFIDDQNGNMVDVAGGTGTVNYMTGVVTVTFATAPLNSAVIQTQTYAEDSSNGGVTDFTQNGSTTGKGKTYNQFDGGGTLQAVWPFDQVQYCFHILKSWYVNLTTDDTQATNLPYRSNFGIPYWRAAFPTDDGILILNNALPSKPSVNFLEIDTGVTSIITIVPAPISDNLDLSAYGFKQCAVRRFGNYDLVAFANVTNGKIDTVNTLMLARNIYSGAWDMLDYEVSCMEQYYGNLIAGDSLSNNVFTLFSGFDDDGFLINNHWTSKAYLFAEGLKKVNRFVIRGLIQSSQNIDIYFATDFGNFIKVFTVVGTASYVNTGNPNIVGSNTVGSQVVGGGNGVGTPIIAYPYEVEFIVGSDLFEYIQVQFQANNIGYCSIDQFVWKDIRWKARKSSPTRFIGN